MCGLCGADVEVGERIFKLPAKRTSPAGGPWVCWTCRWPSAGVTTLEGVLRKVRHRLALHQTIGINKAEARILADALDQAGGASTDLAVDEINSWLRISSDQGSPSNLSLDEARRILIALDQADPPDGDG